MPKKRRKKQRKERARRGYTVMDLEEVWDRWQRGESLKAIGRVFRKEGSSVYSQIAPYGGIRPRTRCRSSRVLSLAEREEISRGIAAKRSMRSIARVLGRSASTISREVRRNGGHESYRASEADRRAWDRARRPKSCRLLRSPRLREIIELAGSARGSRSGSPPAPGSALSEEIRWSEFSTEDRELGHPEVPPLASAAAMFRVR